jgi:hypothetical protein
MSPLVHPGRSGQHGGGPSTGGRPGGRGNLDVGGDSVPLHIAHHPGLPVSGEPIVEFIAPGIRIRARMGDGPAQPTDGYGGWVEVTRPNGVSITEWQGQAPFREDLPLCLDGFATNDSVQLKLNSILGLGRQDGGETEPPHFIVRGPIHYSGKTVVMEKTPDFGNAIRNHDGELVRQELVLHLMEYVPPDRVRFKKVKKGSGSGGNSPGGGSGGSHHHRTKPGENANKVSVAEFGDTSQAAAIGKLNGIRDPRAPIPAGTVLRLP